MSEITLPDGTKEKGKHVGRWNLKGMFSNEDSDVYGAQPHGPLMDVELPIQPVPPTAHRTTPLTPAPCRLRIR